MILVSSTLTNQGPFSLGHPMSARQNKKQRKGRNNVHQRERTVTTLTEDPNTHYLVPTPSEEPAGPPHMPLPFNNPKMHNIQMGSSFQMGANYPYGAYTPFNPMHPNIQQQQQQQQQQQPPFFGPSQQQPLSQQSQPPPQQQSQLQPVKSTLPPGKNDLDILQNLKKIIKDGQHPFFRAVPQPLALASIYMGTIPSQSQAQGRQGEIPGDSAEGQSAVGTIGVSGPASANDTGRRQPPADRGSGPTSGRDDRFPPSGGDTRDHDNVRGRPPTPAERRPYDAEYSAASTRYVESKGPSDDPSGMHVGDRRLSAATIDDRRVPPLHAPDYIPPNRAPGDSRLNPVDSRPQPDSRGAPESSRGPSVDSRSERVGSGIGPLSRASTTDRIVPPQPQTQPSVGVAAPADVDDIQSSRASSLRPTDAANQNLGSVPSPSEEGMAGGARSDMPLEDNGPRPSLKDRLVPPRSAGRAASEHPSHYGDHPGPHPRRPKYYKERGGGGGGGGAAFDGPLRPMPGSGGQAPPRSFHMHSPPPDGHGAKPLPPPSGVTYRQDPPLRLMAREDRPGYRAEYDPRRPDVLDDSLARYGDRSYRDFSPPLGEIPRGSGGDRGGRPGPFPPSPGRAPPGGDISGRRGEWQYSQYPPSPGVPQSWEFEEGWDRSGDRDRFERPGSAGWDYRGERDFIARGAFSLLLWKAKALTFFFFFLDGYSSGPPLDDRGYAPGPPNRDTDRGRPPGPYTPPYGRVRPRSPSPMRRTGPGSMDDSRPAMKRSREDFPPSGYYPPHAPPVGNRDGPGPMRRPPSEYPPPPPPRSGSSGPPPSSASSWPPPPASGGLGAGGPSGDRDRDYRMGRDGMDFPPPSAGYDRPRSPGPLGRHSYGRGGGGGGSGYGRGDPRDRGGYGMPPRP